MYKTFVYDGDSSAYLAVASMNGNNGPHGEICEVEKAECVNHVAKRLGTSLRALKNTGGKGKSSFGGRNKLTDAVIDSLQYYYQVSLNRKIRTSASEMSNEILSSFYYCTSSDDRPNHEYCPKGSNSWCFYNRSLANEEKPKSHSHMKVYFQAQDEQLQQVKAVYDRLTTDKLMTKCLKGMTQNRNEHLHARISRICPKNKNASKTSVDFATATVVCDYNVGHTASDLSVRFGIGPTMSQEQYLKKKDDIMDTPCKKRTRGKRMRRELEFYAAGRF